MPEPHLIAKKQSALYTPYYALLIRIFAWLSLASGVVAGIVLGRSRLGVGLSVMAKGIASWLLLLAVEAIVRNVINMREMLELFVVQQKRD